MMLPPREFKVVRSLPDQPDGVAFGGLPDSGGIVIEELHDDWGLSVRYRAVALSTAADASANTP